MEEIVKALCELVAEQGKQIVALSNSVAIAHEHHSAAAHVIPQAVSPGPNKLWLTEDEEDLAFGAGETGEDPMLTDILREAGLDPHVTTA